MRRVKVNAMSLGHLVRALSCEPMSYAELAEETGLHYHTVREWVNAMHQVHAVHVAAWATDTRGRHNSPLWQLGVDKRDARKPTLTAAQRQQRLRDRKKQAAMIGMMTGAASA